MRDAAVFVVLRSFAVSPIGFLGISAAGCSWSWGAAERGGRRRCCDCSSPTQCQAMVPLASSLPGMSPLLLFTPQNTPGLSTNPPGVLFPSGKHKAQTGAFPGSGFGVPAVPPKAPLPLELVMAGEGGWKMRCQLSLSRKKPLWSGAGLREKEFLTFQQPAVGGGHCWDCPLPARGSEDCPQRVRDKGQGTQGTQGTRGTLSCPPGGASGVWGPPLWHRAGDSHPGGLRGRFFWGKNWIF